MRAGAGTGWLKGQRAVGGKGAGVAVTQGLRSKAVGQQQQCQAGADCPKKFGSSPGSAGVAVEV